MEKISNENVLKFCEDNMFTDELTDSLQEFVKHGDIEAEVEQITNSKGKLKIELALRDE